MKSVNSVVDRESPKNWTCHMPAHTRRRSSTPIRGRLTLFALAASLLVPGTAATQGLTGSLVGTVRDAQGGVLPGATVKIGSPALIGETITVTTDEKGQHRLLALPPGPYVLEIALEGFSTFRETDIRIGAGATIERNLRAMDLLGNTTDETVRGLGTLYTWNLVSPRLGLTMKLGANGRTILRSSYGRFSQGVLTGELEAFHPGARPVTTADFVAASGDYLLHGWGENEYGWHVQGHVDVIMDNLIAEKKARPMIIVMDNLNAVAQGIGLGQIADSLGTAAGEQMDGAKDPLP